MTRQLFDRSLQRRSSNNDYSLQTPRVLKQNWLNFTTPLPALPCLLYGRVNWSWNQMFVDSPSRDLHKCKHGCFIVVCEFVYIFLLYHFCLLVYLPFFIRILLVYFCLVVCHVNKFVVFVFVAFVSHINVKSFPLLIISIYIYMRARRIHIRWCY